MTDQITRARKEWCETPRYPDTRMANICPPDVVSALLEVYWYVQYADRCLICGGTFKAKHRPECPAAKAEAAITRALEQKP